MDGYQLMSLNLTLLICQQQNDIWPTWSNTLQAGDIFFNRAVFDINCCIGGLLMDACRYSDDYPLLM